MPAQRVVQLAGGQRNDGDRRHAERDSPLSLEQLAGLARLVTRARDEHAASRQRGRGRDTGMRDARHQLEDHARRRAARCGLVPLGSRRITRNQDRDRRSRRGQSDRVWRRLRPGVERLGGDAGGGLQKERGTDTRTVEDPRGPGQLPPGAHRQKIGDPDAGADDGHFPAHTQ